MACSVERIGKYQSRICARMGRYQIIKCTIQAKYMPEYVLVCIEYIPIPPLRIGARIDARIEVCIGVYKVSICLYTYQIRR